MAPTARYLGPELLKHVNALQETSTGLQQLHGRLQAIQAEVLEHKLESTSCIAGLVSLSTAGMLMAVSQVSIGSP